MKPSSGKRFLNLRVVLLAIALLLAAFYLFYYQLPGTVALSGSAGGASEGGTYTYAVFYQHYFYGGYAYTATQGSYASLPYSDVSSVDIVGGGSVKIFDAENFTGAAACLNNDIAVLGNIGFNDRIRSFIVYPRQGCQ